MLSSTHCAAPATRAIETCLLPAVGDSSDATVVLPYAADVMACACDAVTPTDVIAFSVPPTGAVTFGAVVRLLLGAAVVGALVVLGVVAVAVRGRRIDKDTVEDTLGLIAVGDTVVVPPADCHRVRVLVWCCGAGPRSPSTPPTSGRATSPRRRPRLRLLAAVDRAVTAA